MTKADAQSDLRIIEVIQPNVDGEARSIMAKQLLDQTVVQWELAHWRLVTLNIRRKIVC
jgi:hypothetical protein